MPITIVPSGEPIRSDTISVVILGNPGTWKTTLANTADTPLLLAFDMKGARRSLKRPDTVLISNWSEIEGLNEDDVKPYKTIIIDTIGRCLDVLADDIMRRDAKMSNGGQLSLQGFGRLKSRFRQWLGRMNGYGITAVMVAHGIEVKQGDETRLRIDGQGSSPEFVYQEADLMGRTTIRGNRSHIDWDPSESGFGKNPARLEATLIPDIKSDPLYLAKCIRTTADFLNRANEEAVLEEKRLCELREHFETSLKTPDDFTKLAQNMRDTNAANSDRAILVGVAKDRGLSMKKPELIFFDPQDPNNPVTGDAAQKAAQQAQGEQGSAPADGAQDEQPADGQAPASAQGAQSTGSTVTPEEPPKQDETNAAGMQAGLGLDQLQGQKPAF